MTGPPAAPLAPRLPRGINPVWQKSARARMRPKHMISWGVVTITVSLFVALIIYTTMSEREFTTRTDAAKAVLPAIVVIQAVLLMVFGTGAVAAGVAQERDEGLLDYQRMTPMSPASKILGYLFGLPVREYALFALTLPIVAAAVAISGFSLLTLAHFYAVFFTSVWVYHMTGLVAGMVAPKPRFASMVSIGLVAVLYFVLPNLSRVGITLFEFLTIRPTFFGLLQQELPEHLRAPAEASGIDSFRDVPLFAGLVHPTVYTLVVQGFLIATMFSVAHRKWRNPAAHLFSKTGALVVFAGVVVFLMGSIWAVIVQEDAYRRVFEPFNEALRLEHRAPETLQLLLSILVVIVGAAYVAIVTAVSPSRHTTIEGWRRAQKRGRARLPINSDAASSLPLALAMLAIALAAGGLVLVQAGARADYYQHGPSPRSVAVLIAIVVGSSLLVQGMRESLGMRVFGVSLFLLWMVPFFTMMILLAAFELFAAAMYVGMPCAPVPMLLAVAEMMRSTVPLPGVEAYFLPPELEPSAGRITTIAAFAFPVTGAVAQAARFRARARLRAVAIPLEPNATGQGSS
ncbi:MAG TPA: hypothetical protein VFF69_14335 [Phycisphaerales bacterium]|nr:hypothetical protein [Phycisphaerales bacterium]